MQEMTTDNKVELMTRKFEAAKASSEEMTVMCQKFADMMSKSKTWIKYEIDAHGANYNFVRDDIEKICAEHEGKRELEITVKNLSASGGLTE